MSRAVITKGRSESLPPGKRLPHPLGTKNPPGVTLMISRNASVRVGEASNNPTFAGPYALYNSRYLAADL
jgi:hypothetical protein